MVLYSLKGLHIGISKIIFVLSLRVALVYFSKGVQIGPANAELEYDFFFCWWNMIHVYQLNMILTTYAMV